MLTKSVLLFAGLASSFVVNNGTTCTLYPESLTHFSLPVDDAPSITQAFEICGINGTVIFPSNYTFNIQTVLNTTGLVNCNVHLDAELLWSTNFPYWLSHSYNVSLQNQSTAWLFGGENVTLISNGGSLNGNGGAWYVQNRNNSNEPGRPISITYINSTNLYVSGLSFIQPQFWAQFLSYSQNVTIRDIYVNATSIPGYSTVNTDGIDTWNSRDIVLENWSVTNGDDCVAAKGNTTNLYVNNFTCYGSNGMTIGSVGQYPDTPDYDENVLFENVRLFNAGNAAYIKSWQGVSESQDINSDVGGGGSGLVRNVTFRNFYFENVNLPIDISQCIYTVGSSQFCDTSKVQIENVTWANFTGTSTYNVAASLHCAAEHPCPDIYFQDINITSVNQTLGLPAYNTSLQHEVYQCANIVNENTTSGIPCNQWAPSNNGQSVNRNAQ